MSNRCFAGLAVMVIVSTLPRAAAAQDLREQVCDDGEPPLVIGGEPTFEVDDDGGLRWLDDTRGAVDTTNHARFRVTARAPVVVRVELALPSDEGRGISLGCGVVSEASVVDVAHASNDAEGRRLLRIAVFRPLVGSDEPRRIEDMRAGRARELSTDALRDHYVHAYAYAIAGGVALTPEALADIASRIADTRESLCSEIDPSQPFVGDVCRELAAMATLDAAALEARVATYAGTDVEATCRDVAFLRSAMDATAARHITTLEVPWTTEHVALVAYDDGRADFTTARDQAVGGVVVVDAPLAVRDVAFRWRRGDRVAGSIAVALGRFARLAGRALAMTDESWDPCRAYADRRVDDALPPAGLVGTRAYVVRDFDADWQWELDVCEGACTDTTVRSTLHITPRRGIEFAVLLEGAGNALSGRISGGSGPDWAYTQPRYRAVGGNRGPEQLYLLDQETRFGRLVTMSALLGVTFPMGETRGLAALGIVLFDGEGRRSFTEGSLRFGVEIAPYFYLTVGTSITRLPLDVDPGQPTAVAVPRSEGPGTTPGAPPLDAGDAWVWSGGLGMAIDLALFGSAAEDIVKALGGS